MTTAQTAYTAAIAQLQAGRAAEAEQHCRTLLQQWPDYREAHSLLGALLGQQGRYSEALAAFQAYLALAPDDPQAWANQGLAHKQLGQLPQAQASYEKAAQLAPGDAALAQRCAAMALTLGQNQLALHHYQRLAALTPDDPQPAYAAALLLNELGRLPEAITALEALLQRHPDHIEAHYHLGINYGQLGQHEQAMACFRQTLALKPDHSEALMNLGGALWLQGDYPAAADTLSRCLAVAPGTDLAPGYCYNARLRDFQWEVDGRPDAETRAQLESRLLAGERVDTPFPFLAVSANAAAQLACGRIASRPWADTPPLARPALDPAPEKLRIAYVSSDFRAHPVSYLLAGVWESHDRCRFETIAISLNPPDGSPTGRRVQAAFDQCHHLGHLSDEAIAQAMAAMGLHIVIDLMAHTQGGRPGILARRPAPVQINYLGYPGSSGMPWLDYLIADPFLVPTASRPHCSEKLLYLPECFQANDDQRAIAPRPSRAALGLPENAFVFCCFNNTYKITPPLFDLWLGLLKAKDGAVLWLYAPSQLARETVQARAATQGLNPARLIFAGSLPYPEHLARLTAADLFLDTLPFNAGTTASDALWAGLPVLTCTGEALAARMAGSLLRNLGLPELVTDNLESYRVQALNLAAHPSVLKALRQRLAQARQQSPVFNTRRFTRHLEAGYEAIWQRHAQGLAPDHISIPALP